jgi:tetratricopeptide (TPR) repeat protein
LRAQEWFERAYTYGTAKNYIQAIFCYSEVIRLKQDFPEAYLGRGLALLYTNDVHDAIVDFTKAINLKQDYSEAYWARGSAQIMSKNYRAAVEDYQKYIDLGGKNENVRKLLDDTKKKLSSEL